MRLILLGLSGLALFCTSHPLARIEGQPRQEAVLEINLQPRLSLDLLFVIDDSDSMRDEQSTLAGNFQRLMLALNGLEGGFPDAHIGVISSSIFAGNANTCENSNGARLRRLGNLAVSRREEDRFISVTEEKGVRRANVPDLRTLVSSDGGSTCQEGADGTIDACDISAAFERLAMIGTDGCGFEQHLAAIEQALGPERPAENHGFLRDEALLAVVVLADEDDCSATDTELFTGGEEFGPYNIRCLSHGLICDSPIRWDAPGVYSGCRPIEPPTEGEDLWLVPPSQYVEFLRSLKDEGDLLFAVIGGPYEPGDAIGIEGEAPDLKAQPSCRAPDEERGAAPGIRLFTVANGLKDDGYYASGNVNICSDDYTPALDALYDRIVVHSQEDCPESPLVGADGTPIERPEEASCTGIATYSEDDPDEYQVVVPQCDFGVEGTVPCPDGNSPGSVAEAPCWYFCDSAGLADRCAYTWQLRACLDGDCSPEAPPPNMVMRAYCSTCILGLPGCEEMD